MEMVAEASKDAVNVNDVETNSNQRKAAPRFLKFKFAYGVTAFALGVPFSAFNTYVIFQLQIIGYTIGRVPGSEAATGCSLTAPACEVPFGGGYIDYLSFFNYINAILYAVSGVLILVLSGLGDRSGYQRGQYVFILVIFGAVCLPVASMKEVNRNNFYAFAALYVLFNFIGFVAGTWSKVFIPYLMHEAEDAVAPIRHRSPRLELDNVEDREQTRREKRERAGLSMSIWGNNALSIGQLTVLIVTIGVTYVSSLYAGLYVSTASGALCIVLAIVAWPFLPVPRTIELQRPEETSVSRAAIIPAITPFRTFMDLLTGVRRYPEAFKLLLAYTIFADSGLVFGSVTSSLFILNVSRDTRIYTAYGAVQPAAALLAGIVFVFFAPLQERYKAFSFKNVMIFSLSVQAFVAIWCCIGISDSAAVGFKHPWEFYLWQAVLGFTAAIVSFSFNVLFAQLFPRGKEIEYFGFQTVLSCATIWIPQIVNGPIVQSTNIIRLPAVVCLATFIVSIVLVVLMDDAKGIKKIEEEAELDSSIKNHASERSRT